MANVQISPSTSSQFSPSIAVNWLNPSVMVVVAIDFRTGSPNIGVYKSMDAGVTWTTTLLPLPTGFIGIESPQIDYIFPSSFVIAARAFDPNGLSGTIVTYTSTDNASSFGPPVIVNQGFGQFINDEQVIVVSDKAGSSPFFGNIYTSYIHGYNTQFVPGNTIFFNRSKNLGNTFFDPILLSSVNEFEEFPGLAITLNGIIIVGWITQPPGSSEFNATISQDGGATFGSETMVASVVVPPSPLPGYQFRCLTSPSLAGDISNAPATRGNVYAVWQDYREGYSDIFMSISTNFGVDWSTPKPIANSPVGSMNFFPAVTVSPSDGTVYVSYYTNRVDPPNIDVFLATSRDGWKTFTNTRMTTTSFSFANLSFVGDYIGNAIVPQTNRLVSVWTDTRTGIENIWFGDNQGVGFTPLTTGIITNTGMAPASNLMISFDNNNLSFSSNVVYRIYVWNSLVSKSLVYANSLNMNANTSQMLNFDIAGNSAYEVQFLVTGQVPTDTVINVFGTDSSGKVIQHEKVLQQQLTQILQLNP